MKKIIVFILCMSTILFWIDPHIVAWIMNDIIPEAEKWSKLVTLAVWFGLLWVTFGISVIISLIISAIIGILLGEG